MLIVSSAGVVSCGRFGSWLDDRSDGEFNGACVTDGQASPRSGSGYLRGCRCERITGATAAALAIPAEFVEKDFWVVELLRSLFHPSAVSADVTIVFKGGTSLSKGFGLTQRFSEDGVRADALLEDGEASGVGDAGIHVLTGSSR